MRAGAIGCDLNQRERQGIVERVDHSEWAAPIIAVPKKDSSFCIYGDNTGPLYVEATKQWPLQHI